MRFDSSDFKQKQTNITERERIYDSLDLELPLKEDNFKALKFHKENLSDLTDNEKHIEQKMSPKDKS